MESNYYFLIPKKSWVRIEGESKTNYFKRLLTGNKQAFGGIQVIYNYCDIINGNGKKAFVVNVGSKINSFKPNWFKTDSLAIFKDEMKRKVKEIDVIIIPECIYHEATEYNYGKKILFVQNWGLFKEVDYEKYGYTGIITVSEFCRDYIEKRTKLPVFKISNGINLALFKEQGNKRVENRILLMTRKNYRDFQETVKLIKKQILDKIEFFEIDGYYSQYQLAELYRSADVFIALGYPEGFSLPPLEAMACGCVVVGFSGGGGLEYMKDGENAIVVKDGDVKELAKGIEKIISEKELKEKLRKNGENKSKEFSLFRMKEELIDVLKVLDSI